MNFEKVKNIYDNMLDEKSKDIFLNRILYSITSNYKYILNILDIKKDLASFLCSDRKVYLFGAGGYGKDLVKFYTMVNWKSFVDNYSKEDNIEGLKVIRFEQLKKEYTNEVIVISSVDYYAQMYEQLINGGFPEESIVNIGEFIKVSRSKQYFEFDADKSKKESFVDAGCFDGNTSKEFIKWCDGNYSNIWAFEPDSENYENCKKELDISNCKVYNTGTYSQEGVINFNSGLLVASNIDNDGDTQIKISKLDNLLKDEEITFIKMDIEGAELEAIKGAESIIRTQKPRLAICVYHKPDDIITIPSLLLEYNSDYKFRLRHYGPFKSETVLYAF